MGVGRAGLLAAWIVCSILGERLSAHQISAVAAQASFERNGTYRFHLSLDVTGSADPAMNELISPEEAALNYLRDALEFRFDDGAFTPSFGPLQMVQRKDPLDQTDETVELETHATGHIPPGAKAFQVRLSPETEVALVMRVEKDGIAQRRAQTLFAGEISRPIDLSFVGEAVTGGDPFEKEKEAEKPAPTVKDGLRAGAARMLAPGGRPALLLLLILLPSVTWRQSGAQLLLFSAGNLVGHLFLGGNGGALAPWLVEILPLAALLGMSYANVSRFQARWMRLVTVTLAGALLGLASHHAEASLGWSRLLSYHGGLLGIGCAVAFVLWLVIGPYRSTSWYQGRLVLPLSVGVAGLALFWLVAMFLPGK